MSSAAVSSLFLLQVLTRASNFALGTVLARVLGPEWFAISNVQLQLASASALFLTKEGLRRACQRMYPGGGGTPLVHGVNLAWVSVPLTAVCAGLVGAYTAYRADPSRAQHDSAAIVNPAEYSFTVWVVCLAAVIEAAAEPAWLYAQANDLIPKRAVAEGVALVLKAVATALLAIVYREATGAAAAFGYAQLVYSLVYVALLYLVLHRVCGLNQLLPRSPPKSNAAPEATLDRLLPTSHRAVGAQYCWQSMQKYALTEGERLVLVRISPLAQQGIFALVSNLGSLVARLILQPIEEVAFGHFSQLAAAELAKGGRTSVGGASSARGVGPAGLITLHALLRGAAIFGGVVLAFGPAYSWLLLRILYGTAWTTTEAPALLALYCAHVCTMAINGVAEAFVHATASPEELTRLSRAMVVLAAAYIPVAAAGLQLAGSFGLVVANCLNMLARIAYCAAFISRAVRAEWADEASGAARRAARAGLALAAASAVTSMARRGSAGREHQRRARAHVARGRVPVAVGVVVMRRSPSCRALRLRAIARRPRGGHRE